MTKNISYKDRFLCLISFLLFFSLIFIGYGFFSQSLFYRSLVFVCALIVPIGLLYFTEYGKDFVFFVKKAFVEVKKLVWPSSGSVLKIALLIVVVMALVIVLISLFDVFWNFLIYQLLLWVHS